MEDRQHTYRTLDRNAPESGRGSKRQRVGRRDCEAPGCNHSTREGKPYCQDHLEFMAGASLLMNGLKQREEELEAVKARGKRGVRVDGVVIGDVIGTLRAMGVCSGPRLARMANLDLAIVESYLQVLMDKGLVVTKGQNRDGPLLSLAFTPNGVKQAKGKNGSQA